MSKEFARESGRKITSDAQLAQLGARDANRELYRATHTGKRARRFIGVTAAPVRNAQ